MPDYEETGSVRATPDDVFDYVSDVANLSGYVPDLLRATPSGASLTVAAEVEGRLEEGEASFRPDRAARRVEWGGKGSTGYLGWLQVSGSADASFVTIHLSTDRTEDSDAIRASLSKALANIDQHFQGP